MAFHWRSRIRVVDTDVSTRIHYTALFRHVEAAETELLRSIGLEYSRWFALGLSVPRIHVEADYLAPLMFDDEIETAIRIDRIGESSFTLGFQVTKLATGEAGARGRLVLVCMEIQSGKSTPIPDAIREAVERASVE
jgi:YbgC/YbaW family acyl-CoA thioester hydrolase